KRLSNGEVIALLNGLKGERLLSTDLGKWRDRLLASPWVRDAALRRSLPSTVEATVEEREPIGTGQIDGGLYLIDAYGVVIDEYGPQYAEFDLPIVNGAVVHLAGESAKSDEACAQLAARGAASVTPNP